MSFARALASATGERENRPMIADTHAQPPSFADLHAGPQPLLLPNAWDVASALGFVAAGFAAVGTTSFGVNAARGTPDGDGSGRDATQELVHRLRALPAYISSDIEDGYSDDPAEVADFVEQLGVAGVNIEDSQHSRLVDPAVVVGKITAIKRAAPAVFVNARVDTYWLHIDDTPQTTIDRAKSYLDAGADGVFVPGAAEPVLLETLAAGIPAPVNVLATPHLTLTQLGDLGIRRVSTGSLPIRAAIDAAVAVAETIRDGGLAPAATSYAEAQRRLEEYARRTARST
ncbi:isocitrate lyase/PEP mutase family protein [Humibacter antri]